MTSARSAETLTPIRANNGGSELLKFPLPFAEELLDRDRADGARLRLTRTASLLGLAGSVAAFANYLERLVWRS